jgi:hypothetical protein
MVEMKSVKLKKLKKTQTKKSFFQSSSFFLLSLMLSSRSFSAAALCGAAPPVSSASSARATPQHHRRRRLVAADVSLCSPVGLVQRRQRRQCLRSSPRISASAAAQSTELPPELKRIVTAFSMVRSLRSLVERHVWSIG